LARHDDPPCHLGVEQVLAANDGLANEVDLGGDEEDLSIRCNELLGDETERNRFIASKNRWMR
jgi:hypothetical protein